MPKKYPNGLSSKNSQRNNPKTETARTLAGRLRGERKKPLNPSPVPHHRRNAPKIRCCPQSVRNVLINDKVTYICIIIHPSQTKAMFNAAEIKELSTSIHSDMRLNGFWDTPRNPMIVQGLIASEMFEAFEGLRKSKRADLISIKAAQYSIDSANAILAIGQDEKGGYLHHMGQFEKIYKEEIKDSVEAEIAGTCIRCFDAIGGWLYEGHGHVRDAGVTDARLSAEQIYVGAHTRIEAALQDATRVSGLAQHDETELFTELLLGMVPAALGIQTGGPGLCYTTSLAAVIDTLKNMCLLGVWFGIDVPTFVALECAYNRTRPRKHGKQF